MISPSSGRASTAIWIERSERNRRKDSGAGKGALRLYMDLRLLGMIRAILRAASAVLALSAVSCSEPEAENTLASMNLHGPVETVATSAYMAVERDGSIEKGEPADYAGMNGLYRFSENGYLEYAESYSGGDLSSWCDYYYDADDRLERIECHSVFFNGDTAVSVEWLNATDYISRTYDEKGAQVAENSYSRSGNRSVERVAALHDTVTIDIRYRRGRPVEERRLSTDYAVLSEYDYDSKGNESAVVKYMDGQKVSDVRMKYDSWDENGNWLRRVRYEAGEDGDTEPFLVEVRRISYY